LPVRPMRRAGLIARPFTVVEDMRQVEFGGYDERLLEPSYGPTTPLRSRASIMRPARE
jgi:hypothetical protein